ncbi:MAG: hypothetical protein K9G33_02315 [Sneathiella sp.]|nr:hypothetical protein [Sneathiella sp.]
MDIEVKQITFVALSLVFLSQSVRAENFRPYGNTQSDPNNHSHFKYESSASTASDGMHDLKYLICNLSKMGPLIYEWKGPEINPSGAARLKSGWCHQVNKSFKNIERDQSAVIRYTQASIPVKATAYERKLQLPFEVPPFLKTFVRSFGYGADVSTVGSSILFSEAQFVQGKNISTKVSFAGPRYMLLVEPSLFAGMSDMQIVNTLNEQNFSASVGTFYSFLTPNERGKMSKKQLDSKAISIVQKNEDGIEFRILNTFTPKTISMVSTLLIDQETNEIVMDALIEVYGN